MLRYRLLFGLLMGIAFGLAAEADHGKPILEHYSMMAILLAYFGGVLAQKLGPAPYDPTVKSFRLHKGTEKW